MGMHFGIVAVRTDVAQLIDAFATTWPSLEPKTSATLAGLDALWAWMDANAHRVSAGAWSPDNPGTEVFGFWQDSAWAVMLDPSYVQASDSKAMAALSERFGLVLSFVIETTGGCAFFSAFDQGKQLRSIVSIDGELNTVGERLAEEAGLPDSTYYMDETEKLQLAFGIMPLEQMAADATVQGASFIDRTDYSAIRKVREDKARAAAASSCKSSAPQAAIAKRPWWRVW